MNFFQFYYFASEMWRPALLLGTDMLFSENLQDPIPEK